MDTSFIGILKKTKHSEPGTSGAPSGRFLGESFKNVTTSDPGSSRAPDSATASESVLEFEVSRELQGAAEWEPLETSNHVSDHHYQSENQCRCDSDNEIVCLTS